MRSPKAGRFVKITNSSGKSWYGFFRAMQKKSKEIRDGQCNILVQLDACVSTNGDWRKEQLSDSPYMYIAPSTIHWVTNLQLGTKDMLDAYHQLLIQASQEGRATLFDDVH